MPNVVIAGAPRCGTTAVFDYLSNHPEVCPSCVKETYFLMDPGYPLYNKGMPTYHKDGLSGYGSFFTHCSNSEEKILLEATPNYLYQTTALEILPSLPGVKLIFILRKPSERIWSLFKYAKNNAAVLPSTISFRTFIEMVKGGHNLLKNDLILQNAIKNSQYIQYLLPYKKRCAEGQMLIYLFEHMKAAPYQFMLKLCSDINIDGRYFDTFDFQPKNVSYRVKNKYLHKTIQKISTLFPPFVLQRNVYLRRMYYRINTEQDTGKSEEDRKYLALLDAEFHSYNERLASAMNVDVTAWE